jgi:hypothetical protein
MSGIPDIRGEIMRKNRLFTTKEAAEEILLRENVDYTPAAVQKACKRNKDIGMKKGRDWMLTEEDIQEIIKRMK